MLRDALLEELADVLLEDVAGGVARLGFAGDEVLARALRDDDDGVVLDGEAAFQSGEEAVRPVKREGFLGDEAEVHDGAGHGGVGGDEAGVAAHELDEADAVAAALGLHVGGLDDGFRRRHGRLEAEGAAHEVEVVVDRLRDADDADRELAPLAFLRDVARRAEGAVAADAEEEVDVHAHEGLDDLARVLLAARGAENGAAEGVDRVDGVGVEQERGEVLFGNEALVAVADAVDRLDAVVEREDLDDALDDVVQARAEAAGREDGGAAPGRVVEDLGVGAGLLEGGRLDAARLERLGLADVGREVDALALLDEEGVADGRVDQALAEVVDVEVVVLRVGDDVCQYAHGGSLDDA